MFDSSLLSTYSTTGALIAHIYYEYHEGRSGLYGDASAGGVLTSAIPVNSLASSSFGRLRYLREKYSEKKRRRLEGCVCVRVRVRVCMRGVCVDVCVCYKQYRNTNTSFFIPRQEVLRSSDCTLLILFKTLNDYFSG